MVAQTYGFRSDEKQIKDIVDEEAEDDIPPAVDFQMVDELKVKHPEEWEVFDYLDRDQDGVVTREDFFDRMGRLGFGRVAKEIMDRYVDAENAGWVTFEHFVSSWLILKNSAGYKALKKKAKMKEWEENVRKRREPISESDEEDEALHLQDGVEDYELLCKKQGIVPSLAVLRNLRSRKADFHASNYNIGMFGGVALAEALKINHFVKKLSLPGNGIGDRGTLAIAASLVDSNVTFLDLSHNNITGIGGIALAEALQEGAYLRTLTLNNNKIFNAVPELLKAISTNHKLIEVGLENVQASNKAGPELAKLFTHNRKLRKLNFSRNNITGQTTWEPIYEALASNVTLQVLELSYTSLREPLGSLLFKSLTTNFGLKTLDLENCVITIEAIEVLAKTLAENVMLETLIMNAKPGKQLLEALRGQETACRLAMKQTRLLEFKLQQEDWDLNFDSVEEVPDLADMPFLQRSNSHVSGAGRDDVATPDSQQSRPASVVLRELADIALPWTPSTAGRLGKKPPPDWTQPSAESWFTELTNELQLVSGVSRAFTPLGPRSSRPPTSMSSLGPHRPPSSQDTQALKSSAQQSNRKNSLKTVSDPEGGDEGEGLDLKELAEEGMMFPEEPEEDDDSHQGETEEERFERERKVVWEVAALYEEWAREAEAEAAASPKDVQKVKNRDTARAELKNHLAIAFKFFSEMATVHDDDRKESFRAAMRELSIQRHRHVNARPTISLQVKLLNEPEPEPEPEKEEDFLNKGYEYLLRVRLLNLFGLHDNPLEEKKRCRNLLARFDVELRRIFQYYVSLDLKAFLDNPSALDEMLVPLQREDEDETFNLESARLDGRLHTRQWNQMVKDTDLANHIMSHAELNRVSCQCLSHPLIEEEVHENPHMAYKSRLGYYEWVETLFRASYQQYPKVKNLSRRMELLLTERVISKGAVDSRDALLKSLWSAGTASVGKFDKHLANLLRMYRYFNLAEKMKNQHDEDKDLKASLKTTAGATSLPKTPKAQSGQAGENLSIASLSRTKSRAGTLARSASGRQREGAGTPPAMQDTRANSPLAMAKHAALLLEGDHPMNFNDLLVMMEKLEMFSPQVNYQKTQKMVAGCIGNKDILPQQHPNNVLAELTYEQFIEVVGRVASMEGGKASLKQIKEKGTWDLIDTYLMTYLFPIVSKVIPGKFTY